MNKILSTVLLLLLGLFPQLKGQTSQFSKDLLSLINAARTNPQGFLKANREKIQQQDPSYIPFLEKMEPIPAAKWDRGLERMGRDVIVNRSLDPKYKGANELCGYASGVSRGDLYDDPFIYLCEFYTNVHNPDNAQFGAYFQKDGYAYFWGHSCETTRYEMKSVGEIDLSGVDFDRLNTARDANYLTDLEKEMVKEINFARAYPRIYLKIIKNYLAEQSDIWGGIRYADVIALKDLEADLSRMEPRSILKPMECVYRAAKRHGIDSKRRGFSGHTGSDGSHPQDRIMRACPDLEDGNENLVSGTNTNPRRGVIVLLVDSGISSRGHRYNLLDPEWKYVGCYHYDGKTDVYGTNVHFVQNFAK